MFLGLAGIGTAAVLFKERRRRSVASGPARGAGNPRHRDFYPPEPPESVSVWVPGPAGNLYVRDGGKSEHVPIIFVHSLAGNGGQWALQLDHLRRRRRAVSLDLRGHGESDPAEDGDYSIAGLAADVEAVADQLGLRRFILAGHSLGSLVAIEYASRHPERVAGLLLVDPNGDLTGMPQDQKEAFVSPLRQDPIGELTSYYRQLVVGGDADAARWVLEDLRLTHEDAVVKALESSMEYPALDALGEVPGAEARRDQRHEQPPLQPPPPAARAHRPPHDRHRPLADDGPPRALQPDRGRVPGRGGGGVRQARRPPGVPVICFPR